MLHYEVAGDGAGVVLLHSTACDSGMWDAEFAALSERYCVLRFDYRGFGRSAFPPGPFSAVDDLRELLDRVGMERAALVGLSAGAVLALNFTLTYPERVRGIVLAAPGIGGMEWSDEIRTTFFEEEDALLKANDLDAAVELNLRVWVDGPHRGADEVDPAVRRRVSEMKRNAFEVLIAAYERDDPPGPMRLIEPPAIERLEEVAVPTLVIVGDADMKDVLERADVLAARVPNARKVVLPGVAHMINLERPQEFGILVLDFLADLPE